MSGIVPASQDRRINCLSPFRSPSILLTVPVFAFTSPIPILTEEGERARKRGAHAETRPPMRRTTSLSDLSPASTQQPIFPTRANASRMEANPPVQERKRVKRRHSTDLSWVDASHFLNCCGLCKRAIGPGCDTFMYRGEVAFCSQECRERQIVEELRKMRKKRSLSSMKKPNLLPPLRRSGAAVKADSVAACYLLGR